MGAAPGVVVGLWGLHTSLNRKGTSTVGLFQIIDVASSQVAVYTKGFHQCWQSCGTNRDGTEGSLLPRDLFF